MTEGDIYDIILSGGDILIFNKTISCKAFAKINLYLDVTKKRDDGFHDIKSIMQSVSLCDDIEICLSEIADDTIECNIPDIPTDSSNLVIKAADSYRKATGKNFGARFKINKKIPSSAGLAGGSSDAAATLRLLNKLNREALSEAKMLEIAASVGSDVPFCYVGGTVLCEGRGEILTSLNTCPTFHIVVAVKGEGVSTPKAYRDIDEIYGDFSSSHDEGRLNNIMRGLEICDTSLICSGLYNIFESVVEKERPNVALLKKVMDKNGALCSMMSGSGPSVFGIFSDENSAEKAKNELLLSGASAYKCTT